MSFELFIKDNDKSYTLTTGDALPVRNDWDYWLEREDGEGQSMSQKDLFDILDKFFEENM